MKKNLTKNIPLKIMSIIVGILVWLIVVNVDDPIITKAVWRLPSVKRIGILGCRGQIEMLLS